MGIFMACTVIKYTENKERLGEKKNAYRVLVDKPGRDDLETLRLVGR
jgi:hypothetical protein